MKEKEREGSKERLRQKMTKKKYNFKIITLKIKNRSPQSTR